MAYPKASAVLLLGEAANGYVVYAASWPETPPPSWAKIVSVLATEEDQEGVYRTFEDRYKADDKTELLQLLAVFVNTKFPVPYPPE